MTKLLTLGFNIRFILHANIETIYIRQLYTSLWASDMYTYYTHNLLHTSSSILINTVMSALFTFVKIDPTESDASQEPEDCTCLDYLPDDDLRELSLCRCHNERAWLLLAGISKSNWIFHSVN